MKIGYFKNFGFNEIKKLKEKIKDCEFIALAQDEMESALKDHSIDLAITDPRDDIYEDLIEVQLADISLMLILQAGNFDAGQQTINLNDLAKIPDLLVAKTEEEASELHYHRDLLQIKSPFLAVESFNEAALMAESGSGYFLMNELTAKVVTSIQLQKMFLLDNEKQLKQKYVALYRQETPKIDKAIKELKHIFTEI